MLTRAKNIFRASNSLEMINLLTCIPVVYLELYSSSYCSLMRNGETPIIFTCKIMLVCKTHDIVWVDVHLYSVANPYANVTVYYLLLIIIAVHTFHWNIIQKEMSSSTSIVVLVLTSLYNLLYVRHSFASVFVFYIPIYLIIFLEILLFNRKNFSLMSKISIHTV